MAESPPKIERSFEVMAKTKSKTGTREWSVASANCVLGCPHRCRYCYARANALRFGAITSAEEWGTSYHRPRPEIAATKWKKYPGPVMFPTSHDITPKFLDLCLRVLDGLLAAGNQVLIVSKPHLDCIAAICDRYYGREVAERIEFRFSIGSSDEATLSYWEPGAPTFAEREDSLHQAHQMGFRTSVSMEPLLCGLDVPELVSWVEQHVTETIWIGTMNHVRQRIIAGTDEAQICQMELSQSSRIMRLIYEELRANAKIRWKDSYQKLLGIDERGNSRESKSSGGVGQ
jgi:DNA repair photolyase